MNDRLASLQRLMAAQQLDGLVCRLNQNVLMLSGYWPMNGLSLVVLPRDGEPILVAPANDERFTKLGWVKDVRHYTWGDVHHTDPLPAVVKELRDISSAGRLGGKRLGMEADYAIAALPAWSAEIRQWTQAAIREMQAAFAGATFVDTWAMLHREASHKTPAEIEKIRLANQVATLALAAFRENVVPGRAECEIAAAVEQAVHAHGPAKFGVRYAKAWANVMSGPNGRYAGLTYNISTSRIVQKGDLVSLELGLVADGYWTDLTRVHAAGKPTARQQEIFDLVLRAYEAGVAATRVGATWSDVDRAARGVMERAGFGEFFPHYTGHGVGFCYHEIDPLIGPASQGRVEAGQIVTIEPAAYGPEWGGVRHEDNILVTEHGPEKLSDFPRGL